MEQVKHNTAAADSVKLYISPNVKAVFVKAQGMLCGSPCGENTEKFTLGENRYDESDWD